MSLWVACLSEESLTLVTDSAVTSTILEVPASIFTQKIWRQGRDLWIAAAGNLRNLPRPPAVWPSLPDDRQPRTFEESVGGVAAQMLGGQYTTGPLYSLACMRAAGGGLQLAKISNDRGVEFGAVGTVFLGGLARSFQPPALIPKGVLECGDLAIALASRTLRAFGHERASNGGPAISWPVFIYQWRTDGRLTAASVPDEAAGLLAEWRDLGNRQMDIAAPVHRTQYLAVMEDCAAKGWHPEAFTFTTGLKIELKPAVGANSATTNPVTEPPTAALPA